MDNIDKKILDCLKNNARRTNQELAYSLNIEEKEVEDRITRLENERVIQGYNTLINQNVGDELTAMIEVKVTPTKNLGFNKIADEICNFPEVDSVFLMSGGFDLVIIIESKTMREVSEFIAEKLSGIEGVTGTATHFILQKYKDHGIILKEKKKDHREQGNI